MNLEGQIPRQVTVGTERTLSPRFSPDGQILAYAQDHDGDEKFDIYLMNLKSNEQHNITPDTDEAILPFFRWSHDSSRIAYASNREGKYSIYTMPSKGGEPTQLSHHGYDDADPQWSPNDRWVMFTSMTRGQDQGVFIIPSDGGEAVQLGNENEPLDASMPDWSPDSDRIVFASSSQGMSDIGVYDLISGKVEWLTHATNECYDPCWSPHGRSVAYTENQDGDIVIVIQEIGGPKRVYQVEAGVHRQLAFTPDGTHLLFTFSGPRRPVDLWSLDVREGKFRQLTNSLSASLNSQNFISPSKVRFRSADGRSIPALLYKPSEPMKGPAGVVYIHGGPTAQHDNDWYPDVHDLLSKGFVVIAPNYRGSTGYGKEFREANRFVMGTDDLADITAAADFLLSEDLVHPERIAVTGLSYGGYLTMCALTKTPERWAAGSALFPFLNWFTEFENEREDLRYWDRQNMGDPNEVPDRFREASPIFFIDRVRSPVQLMAGSQDTRCPLSESVQARDGLAKLGKTVDFIVYEDEGHSFRKVGNRVNGWKRRTAFLEKHLQAQ
jgi:dipeptidyl aminopeptidase/acylaminoacyl peptidase